MKALLAALLALLPACAYAQDEAQPKGMPQLDFANPLTISQIVWMVVIFAALYVLLSTWALPQVGAVLTDRATRIANDLDGARAAKAAADAAAGEAKDAGQRAHAEAQAGINAAVEKAKHEASVQANADTAELDARLARSEQRIAEARHEAMAGLADIASNAAISMIERLSGKPADGRAVEAAVGELLAERAG